MKKICVNLLLVFCLLSIFVACAETPDVANSTGSMSSNTTTAPESKNSEIFLSTSVTTTRQTASSNPIQRTSEKPAAPKTRQSEATKEVVAKSTLGDETMMKDRFTSKNISQDDLHSLFTEEEDLLKSIKEIIWSNDYDLMSLYIRNDDLVVGVDDNKSAVIDQNLKKLVKELFDTVGDSAVITKRTMFGKYQILEFSFWQPNSTIVGIVYSPDYAGGWTPLGDNWYTYKYEMV